MVKAANSLGFVNIPNTGLGKTGYKGLWSGYNVYVYFCEDEVYTFLVDEEFINGVQTCDVFVVGETARIKKTKGQKYSGEIVNGVMVLKEGVN